MPAPGTLFVVATPIGNLEDLTFRGLRTLREVDLIAAEDTRRTAKLLAHYEIRRPMVSLREHNEVRETPRLVARLLGGESIALVSDAGTPGLSDPGAGLVLAARHAGIRVSPIPGASAISAAVSIAGFPGDRFTFLGFPPASGTARRDWIDRLAAEPGTVVFFEAPHRIKRTVADLSIILAVRPIVVNRELTKINEYSVLSKAGTEVIDIKEIGEFVLVVGPIPDESDLLPDSNDVFDLFGRLTKSNDLSDIEALELTALRFGLTQNRIKRILTRTRIAHKRQSGSSS